VNQLIIDLNCNRKYPPSAACCTNAKAQSVEVRMWDVLNDEDIWIPPDEVLDKNMFGDLLITKPLKREGVWLADMPGEI
jgi:hypothetical protein